ncbi:retrovirus-related pol polyprotein from transposon TNT 1-94 [Tanacetum coccineum]
MSEKVKDPEIINKKISHKPIDYEKLNRLSEDSGKRFTPQQEIDVEQAFWWCISNLISKPSNASPIKIEAPNELLKVSLVNESLKKLKFYLARFDNVVKIRTTPDARTEEFFANNDLKAQLQDKDSTICKLKDIIKSLRDKSVVENVKYDYCEIKTKNVELENSMAKFLSENERLVEQAKEKQPLDKELDFAFEYGVSTSTGYGSSSLSNTAYSSQQFEKIKDIKVEDDSLACDSPLEVFNCEVSQLSKMDDDLFTYEVEIANIPCDLRVDDDSEHEADDIGFDSSDFAFTEWNYGSITDEEFSFLIMKMKYPDLLTKDVMGFKTYDNYKDDWIYEWNKDVPWVDEKPWTDTGVWTYSKPVIHTCKPFNYKTGCSEWPTCSWMNDGYCNGGNLPGTFIIENQLHYQDYEWYEALEDSELKDEALRNKAIMERFIKDDDDESNYEQMRRWDIYTNYDDTYKTNHDDNEREELCEVHEPPSIVQSGRYRHLPCKVCKVLEDWEVDRYGNANLANVVPPKNTTSHSVETQKPELKVYSRKPKNVKNVGSSKKAKIVESKNANHSKPNSTWGSNATDIPSSSSSVMTGCPDCSLVSGLRMFETHDRIMGVNGDYHQKNTCFIRNLEGVDLLSGSRDTNLYTISLDDMLKTSPICLLSKASKTKSWLWHRRLSHLNLGTINKLARDGLARGTSRLKFQKDHLCSACAVGKRKKSSHQPKAEDTNQENLIRNRIYHFFHVFGALCYPTNDNDDLGKLDAKPDIGIFVGYAPAKKASRIYNKRTHKIIETIHVTFDELTAMASEQFSSGPGLQCMTLATSSSGLVPNLVSQQPCIPPNRDDWNHLFQPMFDEYFTPPPIVITPVQEVAAPRAVVLADSPVSTSIDQDAPSSSTPSTQEREQSTNISQGFEESLKTPLFRNDPLNESPHEESTSQGSSSNVIQSHTLFEHLAKWTKNHPIANVISDPSRSVSTRKQLKLDAMWWLLIDAIPNF